MSKYNNALVIGGGAAGLSTALGLAQARIPTRIIGVPEVLRDDGRSAALFLSSLDFLDTLGVGEALRARGAPLRDIRIIDVTGALVRSPTVTFKASEIGQNAFGWNIPNVAIIEVLSALARATPGLGVSSGMFSSLEQSPESVRVTLDTGEVIIAAMVVGADGKNSPVRKAARIGANEKSYPQSALTCRFSHSKDHEDRSLEFHTREGPFTCVPVGENRSALVWIMKPERAAAMHALSDIDLGEAITRQSSAILGVVKIEGARGLVPMRKLVADRLTEGRVALVGEAAHAFPPIGAQGLNLGLKDVAALIARAGGAARAGADIGGACLGDYARDRKIDVNARSVGVDMLNSALIADTLLGDIARAFGLRAMRDIAPLRRLVMRIGGWSPLFTAG